MTIRFLLPCFNIHNKTQSTAAAAAPRQPNCLQRWQQSRREKQQERDAARLRAQYQGDQFAIIAALCRDNDHLRQALPPVYSPPPPH